jgi:hypothetical protein
VPEPLYAISCAQIHDYAQLNITVGLSVLFSDELICALLVYYDPVVHQAFDVLLDTIINHLCDYL